MTTKRDKGVLKTVTHKGDDASYQKPNELAQVTAKVLLRYVLPES